MIPKLSSRISSFLLINNIIVGEDEEIYQYSFEVLLSTIINFIAIVFVAFLTRTIPETTLYLIGFIPLRITAGGYHARTHFRCFVTLMCTYLFFVLIIKFLPGIYFALVTFLSTAISLILIFSLAQVDNRNKPLSENETSILKTKSRI